MLRIRQMLKTDIPFAVNLTNLEGWGIPPRDFRRILYLEPKGSFVATDGARKFGLTTTTSYGREIAWIGNVVVQKNQRGKHIGQALVEHAVTYLGAKRVRRIALYSFKENVAFYLRLGFQAGYQFVRLRREPNPGYKAGAARSKRGRLPISQVLLMDRRAFGADRGRLLKHLLNSRHAWYQTSKPAQSQAYVLVKTYADMDEIGPWVSFRGNSAEMELILQSVISRTHGRPLEVACPSANKVAVELLQDHKFNVINRGFVMYHKKFRRLGRPNAIVAFGFLDKG